MGTLQFNEHSFGTHVDKSVKKTLNAFLAAAHANEVSFRVHVQQVVPSDAEVLKISMKGGSLDSLRLDVPYLEGDRIKMCQCALTPMNGEDIAKLRRQIMDGVSSGLTEHIVIRREGASGVRQAVPVTPRSGSAQPPRRTINPMNSAQTSREATRNVSDPESPRQRAEILLDIHKRNSIAKKPVAIASRILQPKYCGNKADAGRILKHLLEEGFLKKGGKVHLTRRYALTEKAAGLIEFQLGQKVDLEDLPEDAGDEKGSEAPMTEAEIREGLGECFREEEAAMSELLKAKGEVRKIAEQLEGAKQQERVAREKLKEAKARHDRLTKAMEQL